MCDMNMVSDSPIIDTIFTKMMWQKKEKDDLALFWNATIKPAKILWQMKMRERVAMQWYADEGITYSDSDMSTEVAVKDYFTRETVDTDENPLGAFMLEYRKVLCRSGNAHR